MMKEIFFPYFGLLVLNHKNSTGGEKEEENTHTIILHSLSFTAMEAPHN